MASPQLEPRISDSMHNGASIKLLFLRNREFPLPFIRDENKANYHIMLSAQLDVTEGQSVVDRPVPFYCEEPRILIKSQNKGKTQREYGKERSYKAQNTMKDNEDNAFWMYGEFHFGRK